MKKLIFALTMLLVMTTTARAMSYEQARNQALFLADKMAYELNLNEEQYEAAYEINLDYLMGVNTYDDLYGPYWRQRNLDLSYVLLDWQYNAFCAASYFYRPLYWSDGYWHFGIYSRYPRRNYFYYGRPSFINVYVGGHSWRSNGGRSWYHGRDWGRPAPGTSNHGNVHFGMRDGFKRGDYNRGFDFARSNRQQGTNRVNSNFGGTRSNSTPSTTNGNFGTRRSDNQVGRTTPNTSRSNNSSFGGARSNNTQVPATRSNSSARESSTRTTVRNFGSSSGFSTRSNSRENQTPANSFMPSNRSSQQSTHSSFGGSRSTGSSRSNTSGGGGHFGGRR